MIKSKICVMGNLDFHPNCAKICIDILDKILNNKQQNSTISNINDSVVDNIDNRNKLTLKGIFNTTMHNIHTLVVFKCAQGFYPTEYCVITYNTRYIERHRLQLFLPYSSVNSIYKFLAEINDNHIIKIDEDILYRCDRCVTILHNCAHSISNVYYCIYCGEYVIAFKNNIFIKYLILPYINFKSDNMTQDDLNTLNNLIPTDIVKLIIIDILDIYNMIFTNSL